jgi:hypothetical protein
MINKEDIRKETKKIKMFVCVTAGLSFLIVNTSNTQHLKDL